MTIVLRTMPIELLKNPDLKSIGQPLFTSLNKEQMFGKFFTNNLILANRYNIIKVHYIIYTIIKHFCGIFRILILVNAY